ncbi:type II toxin-antitoxin system HicA family toxin [Pleurocapsales cyanobacterium LEGE 10410]|nr:type II toxin-antitoxin system HicA family toxin [Pleurocapsales cyanobacterium LEGE 10410]
MGKKDKLLNKAKNSAANLRFNDLIKLAELCGFEKKRQKGSHVIMKHKTHDIFMNFQDNNGDAKPYQVKQLLKEIDDYNL